MTNRRSSSPLLLLLHSLLLLLHSLLLLLHSSSFSTPPLLHSSSFSSSSSGKAFSHSLHTPPPLPSPPLLHPLRPPTLPTTIQSNVHTARACLRCLLLHVQLINLPQQHLCLLLLLPKGKRVLKCGQSREQSVVDRCEVQRRSSHL
jgi:hypothetical protein